MVGDFTVLDGRYLLPSNLLYTKNQHVYLDIDNKKMGLDEIGYAFLKNPTDLEFLSETEVKIGEPFAVIATNEGMTTLNSPCTGKIKRVNKDALKYMKNDVYNEGFLVELEEIKEIHPSLISGPQISEWGQQEAKCLLGNFRQYKIIAIGDTTVGKTAIKVKFTDGYYKKDLKTTLSIDFGSRELKCEYISSDLLFSGSYKFTARVNIWDAAGQEYYDKYRGMYYRGAKGAIICYDVSNPVTFQNLDKWVQELEDNLSLEIPVILVGNKLDLGRKVSRQQALDYAYKHNFDFMEVSAKTGEGIVELFTKLCVEIYKKEENLE